MAQLSRPYQIALAVVAVLGLVWAVALRAHGPGSSPSEPVSTKATAAATSSAGTASASSSTNAAAEAKAAAAPTPIYHGAAPGVEGLTRAIAKAHGAVATSQRNAQELQHKSGEASQETQTPSTTSGTSTSSATSQKSLTVVHRTVTHATAQRTVTKTHVRVTKSANQNAAKAHPGRSPQQVAVEAELARGKTVMLVFWDPKSSVDRDVLTAGGCLGGWLERHCDGPRGFVQPGRSVWEDHRSRARLPDSHDPDRQPPGRRQYADRTDRRVLLAASRKRSSRS